MKHGKKIIIAALLAMCLLGCTLLAACDNNNNKDNPYVITIVTDADAPVSGVRVIPQKGGTEFPEKTTGADGKVSFNLAEDTYTFTIVSNTLPNDYVLPDGEITLSADNRTTTVKLVEKPGYKVTLINEDGTPFYAEGVYVGVCTFANNCLAPQPLGTDGTVKLYETPNNYKVNIVGLPEGYTFDFDEYDYDSNHGYYSGEHFTEEYSEIIITIYQISTYDLTDGKKMSLADKQAFSDVSPYPESQYAIDAFEITDTIGGGKYKFYSFLPAISGDYLLYAPSEENRLGYSLLGTTFNHDPENAHYPYYYKTGIALSFEAGKQNYMRINNPTDSEQNIRFVLVAAVASSSEVRGVNPTAEVTIGQAGASAVIAFTATQAGAYEITAQGDELVNITRVSRSPDNLLGAYDGTEFVKNATVSHKILDANTTVYYLVSVKDAAAYPVSFDVKIKQLNQISNVTNKVQIESELSKYEDQTGTLTALAMSDKTVLVYNDTDGYYHLGSEDGAVVLVNLTGTIAAFAFGDEPEESILARAQFAYLDKSGEGNISYVFDVTTDADRADLTKGNTYVDYTTFLRGFTNYSVTQGAQGPVLNIPTTIPTQSYYTKYVNSDGVYPLTEELKTFVELFWNANSSKLVDNIDGANEQYGWMFPLCYYAD